MRYRWEKPIKVNSARQIVTRAISSESEAGNNNHQSINKSIDQSIYNQSGVCLDQALQHQYKTYCTLLEL